MMKKQYLLGLSLVAAIGLAQAQPAAMSNHYTVNVKNNLPAVSSGNTDSTMQILVARVDGIDSLQGL